MRKLIISLSLLSVAVAAAAQNGYDAVLQQIEANSITLNALRKQTEAQKLDNRTGIYPANPEVEMHYLWGSPRITGNRTDFAVSQSFDFPTAYGHRSKIAGLRNANAERIYLSERIYTLLSAKQVCIDLVYYNALAKETAVRLQNAESIAAAYQTRLEKGDANRLEYNKAQLNLTAVQAEQTRIEAEQTALLLELQRMNGGKAIRFPDAVYPAGNLPAGFEDWYAGIESRHPALQYANGQIEIGRQQVKLNRALGLPGFSTGYMSEKVAGEQFQGITLGISIPLWENKNRVKQAKAQVRAAESALDDNRMQVFNRLQNRYIQAVALQKNAQKLRSSLSENNNEPLLKKALEQGEISLLNYFLEIEYYYEAVNKVLEAERDYERAGAELLAVEL
ncbi:MAG: TolC family protein [Dysgonamonadaceae bacterium]|jgi:outer membrane protein TolC|nr:TolC family protein [Dysgonamonadaceae bacterium]